MTAFGQSFDRCPKAWLRDAGPDVAGAIEDWDRYERKGMLPGAGGYLDQTATFVDSMRTLSDEAEVCKRIAEQVAKTPKAQS